MTRKLLLILVATFLSCFTKAQTGFFKSFNVKTVSDFNRFSDMVLTYDSAFVIACESFDSTLMLPTVELIKIDSGGQFVWRQTFQFPEGAYYIKVIQTPDSGLIVTATTNFPADTTQKIAMIKMDRFGTKQWVKLLGDNFITHQNSSLAIKGNSIFILSTGAVKLGAGLYANCCFLANTDLNGNINWYKRINWQGSPYPKAIEISSSKEIYISAEIVFNGNKQFALSKMDSTGNIIWSKVYPQYAMNAWNMKLDSSNNLILIGRNNVFNLNTWDILLMKIDTSGNFIWGKSYGNGALDVFDDEGYVVFQTPNGYMICAEPETFGNNSRAALMQTDFNGNLLWMKIYGDSIGSFPNGAVQLNNGYIIYGIKGTYGSNAPIYLLKTDLNGVTSCKWTSVTLPTSTFTILPFDTGTTANVQGTMIFDFTEQVNTLTETDECLNTLISFIPSYLFDIQANPNPFQNQFTLAVKKQTLKQLSIKIKNVLGKIVFSRQENNLNDTYTKAIDLSLLARGIYLLEVNIDGERTVKKIVKE